MASPFRFKNAALMMALAAAYPVQSYASAGTALFSAGDVTVRRGTTSDPLVRGGALESGDSILTGAGGRAQVRFSDGGLVSLMPNSQFNITRYVDANDAKKDSFLVDLLRGGMRAITGLIGKRDHDNYKVTTSTATIGIRGSAFLMSYLPDGTLVVSTEQDAIVVCTQAGCTGLAAGESAHVVSNSLPAVRTSVRAFIPVPDPVRTPVVVGNGTRPNGWTNLITPPPAATSTVLTGMAFAGAGLVTSGTSAPSVSLITTPTPLPEADDRGYGNGALVLQTDGTPSSYLAQGNASQGNLTGTATVLSSSGTAATGDLLLLGTWSASTWTTPAQGGTTTTLGSSAFVTGQPMPASALASMAGKTAQYTFSSGTPVFSTQGAVGQILNTSTLSVDFLGVGTFADVNLNVRMPLIASAPPAAVTSVTLPNTTDFSLRGGVQGTGSSFAGDLSVSSAACIAGTDRCGIGSVQGFLAGPTGGKAGLSFTGSDGIYGAFGGAATFAQTGSAATAQTAINTIPALVLHPLDGATVGSSYPNFYGYSTFQTSSTLNAAYNGNQLTGFVPAPGATYLNSIAQTNSGQSSYGTVGQPGDNGYVGWGYWARASTSYNDPYYNGGSNLADVHFVVAAPTPNFNMPVSGTAYYSLIGGTAPTFTSGTQSTSQTGQLQSASMNVNFGTSTASLNIATMFGTTPVIVSASTGNGSNSLYLYGSNFISCGSTSINGVFTGDMAYRAGLSYRTNATIGNVTGNVTGALALQQTSSSGLLKSLP